LPHSSSAADKRNIAIKTLIDTTLAALGERISLKQTKDFLDIELPMPHPDDHGELVGLYGSIEASLAPPSSDTLIARTDEPRARRGMIVQLVGACRDQAVADLAVNLCITAAQLIGKRVLLLDDTNRPAVQLSRRAGGAIAQLVNMTPTGSSNARLVGSELYFAPLRDRISGALPSASITQFASELDALRPLFDLIVVRGPSMPSDPFARLMAPLVDASVVVVEAERTRARDVARMQDQISLSGGAIAGSVMVNQREHLPRWLARMV